MDKTNKKLRILMVFILLIVFVSGCDSKDINRKEIITTIVFDKKDDEMFLYAEYANIDSGGNSEENKGSSTNQFIYVKSRGKDIAEARLNMDRQLKNENYLSGVRMLILTEEFAKEHLVEYLFRFRAEELLRKKILVVITKDNPVELFRISQEKDDSLGLYIFEMLMTLEDKGETFNRTVSRVIENLSTKYTGILLPCIGVKDNEISLVGYSVVNGPTVNGFLPVGISKGTILLKADKPKLFYMVQYQENNLTIETSQKKRKIKPYYVNGNIFFDMKFDFEAKLMYGNIKTPYNFGDAANAEVTEMLIEMIKKDITDAVELAQKEYKCDYLQLDDEFRVKFPVDFEEMDWEKEFQEVTYNIDVKVKLSSTWMMDYETNVQK